MRDHGCVVTPKAPAAPSRLDVRARARAVLDAAVQACDAYGRTDLSGHLATTRREIADPSVHVVVVGEFKQGKSSLVNALVGADVCPVDDDIATAVPTYVRYGDPPQAELIFEGDPPERRPVALAEVRRWAVEGNLREGAAARGRELAGSGTGGGGADEPRLMGVEIRIQRQFLAGGLVLVDTPGVGGLGSTHATSSLSAASMADALLFVTDAGQELTRSEKDFLNRARELCPTVACVLTKTDFYPAWRQIRDLTTAHLGTGIPVIPVASPLRAQAARTNDAELNQESGFPDLVRHLRELVGGGAAARLAARAANEVLAVCEQIESQFQAERAALADPARAQRVVSDLTAVKQRVETLRSAAARWSTTLSDGVADLTSDVDHDLRERIREVLAEADRAIEQGDPVDTWSELERWLEARVAHEMLANYTLLRDRATALSEEVGRHFEEASGEVLRQLAVANPTPLATSVHTEHRIDLKKMGLGQQAMTALKATYGGALMFIMLGVLVGVSLTPVALGIGLLMGRKGLKDEKQRQVQARQAQAKNAARRYCDEVSFVMGKDSRDTLRRIQRQLRDHYTGLAEQLNRSNNEALRAATEASQRTEAERRQRLADLDAEIERVGQLRGHAEALLAVAEAAGGGPR